MKPKNAFRLKAAALCLWALVLLPIFASCSTFGPGASVERKMRSMNIGQGYSCKQFWRTVTRRGQGMLESYIIPDALAAGFADGTQTIEQNGKEYKTRENENSRVLRWKSGGYTYILIAQDKEAKEFASPDSAEKITSDPLAALEGMDVISDERLARFYSKSIVVEVSYSPVQFAKNGMGLGFLMIFGPLTKIQDGDIEYYYHKGGGIHSNMVNLYWNTDIGSFFINGGPGPNNSSDSGAEAEDFINADLIRTITRQMGAKMMPLPEATASPN